MSVAEGTIAAPRPVERWLAFAPQRVAKIVLGGAIVGTGLYGVFSTQQYVSTDAAVMSGYVTTVRSPIDGDLSGLTLSTGTRLQHGTVLAEVRNARVNEEKIADLRQSVERAETAAASGRAERRLLIAERTELQQRAKAHSLAVTERLALQVTAAGGTLAASSASMELAAKDFERTRQLHESGIVSDAEYDRAQAAERVTREEYAAQQDALKTLQVETHAAKRGLLIESGANNDVAYSQQRAEEIGLRLAENARQIAMAEGEAKAAQEGLTAQEHATDLRRAASLSAPLEAMVWRLEASNGEHIAASDAVVQLVNCNNTVLMAAIPQERVPDMMLGASARVRLSGEREERRGTVQFVTGDPREIDSSKFAALPVKNSDKRMATVFIQLNDSETGMHCDIGRTARVMIQAQRSNLAERWMRRYF